MYAIGGSAEPTINSQGNRYLAPVNPFAKEVYTVLQYGEFRIKFLHHSNKEFLTSYWIWWIRYDQVTKRVDTAEGQWKGWNWRSEGDLMLNGAYFTPSGAGASASYARASSLGAKSSSMVGTITSGAGVLGCRRGHQCWLCPPSPTISKTKRSLFFFLAPFFAFFILDPIHNWQVYIFCTLSKLIIHSSPSHHHHTPLLLNLGLLFSWKKTNAILEVGAEALSKLSFFFVFFFLRRLLSRFLSLFFYYLNQNLPIILISAVSFQSTKLCWLLFYIGPEWYCNFFFLGLFESYKL